MIDQAKREAEGRTNPLQLLRIGQGRSQLAMKQGTGERKATKLCLEGETCRHSNGGTRRTARAA